MSSEKYTISEAAEVFTGFPFDGRKYNDSEGVRVLRGENVTIGELRWDTVKFWNEHFTELKKYELHNGDVVIGMDGSRVGKNRAQIRKRDLPLLLAQRVARLRAKEGFCQDYLAYVIKSDLFERYVESIKTGTSIPHISGQQIKEFEFYAPPLSIQRKIAAILTALDDKIELNRRMNETLEGIAQAVWGEWFGKWETSDLTELGEVVEFNPRVSIAQSEVVVYVEMKDLPQNGMCISGLIEKPFTSGSKFQLNDTLLARITPCLENGKTAFVNFLKPAEKAFGSTEFVIMRAKGGISPYFVYFTR